MKFEWKEKESVDLAFRIGDVVDSGFFGERILTARMASWWEAITVVEKIERRHHRADFFHAGVTLGKAQEVTLDGLAEMCVRKSILGRFRANDRESWSGALQVRLVRGSDVLVYAEVRYACEMDINIRNV